MKPFLIAAAALLLALPATASTHATIPADQPLPSPCERHTQKIAVVKTGNYDLAMIGDSITQTVGDSDGEWLPLKTVWDKHFAPRHAINLGYSGYRTENILWNLQNGELDFTHPPKVVTLLIGTNNTDDQHYPTVHTAEEVFAGTKAIVDLIRQRLPTTKILILRIFPCGGPGSATAFSRKYNRSESAIKTVRRAGELTAQLADGKQVFWLDVGHVFLRPDGSINTDLMPDLIHPNAAGAEAWAQAIEPTLAQLMGDQPIVDAPNKIQPEPAAFIKRLQAGEKITLVTMGTSLTGGTWRWPDTMMVGWLDRDFTGQVTLFNEGVGASASSVGPSNNAALSGLGKLPAVLAHKPDVVFIEFSINDAYLPYKITPEDSKKNLNTIIDRILEVNPKTEIILQTMNSVKDKPEHGAEGAATQRPMLADYVEGYRNVAKARGLRLIDHYPHWQKLMQEKPAEFDKLVPDGVHPQGEGYWNVLLPELKHELMPPPPDRPVTYLQNPTDHGMTVCFLTPSAETRDVTISLTSNGAPPSTAPHAAMATAIPDTAWTIWKSRINDLKPGTNYQYQVRYRINDKPVSTPVHRFRTPDSAAKSLRAIAFNDTHMGVKVMTSLLYHIKPEDFDFSLLLGDILEGSKHDGTDVFESWTRYVELLDGANKPIVYVRGNHDTRGAFAKRLAFLFDLPNLDPSKPWGEEQWQYLLRSGPVEFLALDTCEDDDDSTPKTSYKNPDLWQKVRQRQTDWFKASLATRPASPAPWHVLLTHMPLYNSPWCSVRSRNLWTPLLGEWKPDLALSGHDHTWRKPLPLPQGAPWPSLTGGGPAMSGGEEGTMMVLSADDKSLHVRLIGSKDGRQLTEFSSVTQQENRH